MSRPALFLDRDGVINIDYGYVHTTSNFDFIKGIFDLVLAANSAGYLVVIVTNQAGIGRGYYTEDQFLTLMDWVKQQFLKNAAKIDNIYFCPYHPDHGIGKYRRKSFFRKPAPGMFLKAKHELDIDMSQSILIGDNASDIAAGYAAGVKTLIHFNGKELCDNSIPIKELSEAILYL